VLFLCVPSIFDSWEVQVLSSTPRRRSEAWTNVRAAQTAGSGNRPWRQASSPALSFALPNACTDSGFRD